MSEQMKNIKTLEKLIFEILSDMFFVFPEDEEPEMPEEVYEGVISINGNTSMYLHFFIAPELAKVMAENFIGEEMISEEDILETVKEFVNMVAGNYIGIIDPEGKRELGLPKVKRVKTSEIKRLTEIHKYQVESCFLGFWVEE